MKTNYKYFILVLITLCTSCTSYKDVPYFQNLKGNSEEKITNYSPLTIQTQDLLGINVTSLNPESSAIYNSNLNRINGNNLDNNQLNPIFGYLVNEVGDIQFPTIGKLKVVGKTTTELQEIILKKIGSSMKEPAVTVRMMNFKVSVLGDVAKPGAYPILNERVTVTEAIGLAGDLNITALRKTVMLVREVDGKRQYLSIDLTSKDLFNSPYYYLRNNDVIVVQPGKTKFAQVSRGYQTGTLLLSALSIAAIIFTAVHK